TAWRATSSASARSRLRWDSPSRGTTITSALRFTRRANSACTSPRLRSFSAMITRGTASCAPCFWALAIDRPKNGPLLSKARLVFVAEFAERFGQKVIAELRGKLDANGRSAFWEGLGRHFFAMEYSRADYLTGIGRKAFIAELMPRHPVYTQLLPAEARAVIGEVHADTLPARAMLESEGFRYEGYVDIFDAGPTLECFRDIIRAVRQSRALPVRIGEDDATPDGPSGDILWLVSNRSFESFRATLAPAPARISEFPLLPHAAKLLGVGDSDAVRAVPLSAR